VLLKDWPAFGRVDERLIARRFKTRVWKVRERPRYIIDALGIFFLTAFTDLTVTRWAHTQAYWQVRWGRLLGKKTIVLIGGGADTVDEEWLGRKFSEDQVTRLTFLLNNATLLIANSNYIRGTLRRFTSREDALVVYDGFDPKEYFLDGRAKERMVLTVCPINKLDVARKGLDTLIEAARRMPDVTFAVIGSFMDDSIDRLRAKAPPNVEFMGHVDDARKIELMRKARVYAQLSTLEGCPWAISEAMLCECIPVATDTGGTPEVVGDTGFYAKYGDVETTVAALTNALGGDKKGAEARNRIARLLSLDGRAAAIGREIDRLISSKQ